jgi:hypothetical protein
LFRSRTPCGRTLNSLSTGPWGRSSRRSPSRPDHLGLPAVAAENERRERRKCLSRLALDLDVEAHTRHRTPRTNPGTSWTESGDVGLRVGFDLERLGAAGGHRPPIARRPRSPGPRPAARLTPWP